MDSSRLFALDAIPTAESIAPPQAGAPPKARREFSTRPVPAEHLNAAEAFLEASGPDEPLAAIQAAILLCEGAGDVSRSTLRGVQVDGTTFPRSAAAVDWALQMLDAPRVSWPDGFWPRFLLNVLHEEQPP